jgi:TamB, inner membrane protein subunit of TAM complex
LVYICYKAILLKKLFKILAYTILLLLILLVSAYFLVQKESVQNWLVQKVTKQLSDKLHTTVKINHIKIDFLNHLNVQGVFVQDDKKDTLLYAGNVQFKITDWFILKKEKPLISYVALENALVNLNRTKDTSRWNYDFITDAFASKTKSTTTPTSNTANNANDTTMQFDLKEIVITNVRFNSIDKWAGINYIVQVGNMNLNAKDINWKNKLINLDKINFASTYIRYDDYPGGRPPQPHNDSIDKSAFNPYNWRIDLKEFEFKNGGFYYDLNYAKPIPNVFNEEHIAVSNLNFKFETLKLLGDTLAANIVSFNAKDRCGFEIKKLTANAKLNPVSARLDNLEIITNHSTIKNYYEMVYSRFPDFNDYLNKVIMKAHFTNSNISFADIAYFAPEINALPIKNVIIKDGDVIGTVTNLIASNINLQVGNSSLLGSLSMKGLPNIETTFIELKSKNLSTSGSEIIKYIPAANVDAVAWNKLTSINYVGSYKGYIRDFVTDGTLTTNQGSLFTNIHMTLQKTSKEIATYDGFFTTNNLQLGTILKQNAIGNLSASGKIKGQGFDLEHLNAHFDGKVNSIATKEYNYQNITIDGTISNKKFEGKINANDPNIAMNFDGKLDFSQATPDYKLRTQLVKFDLQKLGLSKLPIKGSAFMDLNFKGSTLDNFIGNAKLYNVKLTNGDKNIALDSAILNSTNTTLGKKITLLSNAADANIEGHFSIVDLPLAMQYYLSNYLPAYINKPKNIVPQQFNFNIDTKNIESIIKTFVPKISGCNNAKLVGSLDMINQNLKLNVIAPNFTYDNTAVNNIVLTGNGNFESIIIDGSTNNIIVDNKINIPSTNFNAVLGNDSAALILKSAGGIYNVKDALLQAKGYAYNKNLFVNILPSTFYLNNKKWTLQSQNELVINKTEVIINNIILENGLQKIQLNSSGINNEDIVAHIENLDIKEISSINGDNNIAIAGRINGDITINKYATTRAYSGQVSTTDIKYNNEILGKLNAALSYNESNKIITVSNTSGIKYGNSNTNVYGTIDMSKEDAVLDLQANLFNTPLKTFENFLQDFISDSKGIANGKIEVKGPLSNYKIDGHIRLKDVQTKVIYLGTTYFIDDAKVDIDENKIDFSNTILFDAPQSKIRNTARITQGKVLHNHFKDVRFDIILLAEKFQFLNTTETDNPDYYGPIIAKGALFIEGPLENITLSLVGTTLKGTHLYIPVGDSYDDSKYDYITFKTYGNSYIDAEIAKPKKEKILKVDLTITATPDAEISIILDKSTGEEIYGRGTGDLNINIDLGKAFAMNGTITTVPGCIYKYKFRDLFNRDLNIEPGGTITWNGDPVAAILNLTASYKIAKASLLPLINNYASLPSDQQKQAATQYPTFVKILLKNKMTQPDISYDIDQPDNTDYSNPGYARLIALKNNPQEKITQVGSLLLTGQFLSANQFTNNTGTTNLLINNISNTLSPTLSNIVSNNLNKILGTKDLKIEIDYNASNNDITGTNLVNNQDHNVRLKYSKSFLNERLNIEFDNNINYSRYTNQTNFNPLGDFKLQYDLKQDGRLKLSVFRKTFTDITTANNNSNIDYKNGLSIIYRKNFENLNEIFKSPTKQNIIGPLAPDSFINTKPLGTE